MLNTIDIIKCLKDAQRAAANKCYYLYKRYLMTEDDTRTGLLNEYFNARDQANLLTAILKQCQISPYFNDRDIDKLIRNSIYGKLKERHLKK
jgi:hypothetical protein